MGNLHAGHEALVRKAMRIADRVTLSLFVNPTQFDDCKDFDNYPRTEHADFEYLRKLDVNLVFAPGFEDIYPADDVRELSVEPGGLAEDLCGKSRPGHFRGVVTVMAKLFNIFTPDYGVFGEKDYQQLVLIKRLVRALNFDVEVIAVPTVRDSDGLALSSRNSRLDAGQRKQAPLLYRTLSAAAKSLSAGGRNFEHVAQEAKRQLQRGGFTPEYVEIREAETLLPITEKSVHGVILAAARLGRVRLIDNVAVMLK